MSNEYSKICPNCGKVLWSDSFRGFSPTSTGHFHCDRCGWDSNTVKVVSNDSASPEQFKSYTESGSNVLNFDQGYLAGHKAGYEDGYKEGILQAHREMYGINEGDLVRLKSYRTECDGSVSSERTALVVGTNGTNLLCFDGEEVAEVGAENVVVTGKHFEYYDKLKDALKGWLVV